MISCVVMGCGAAAAARQSFKEQEALVYQQLAQLIRDGVWLKSYLAAVMRLEQEAFQVRPLFYMPINKVSTQRRVIYLKVSVGTFGTPAL